MLAPFYRTLGGGQCSEASSEAAIVEVEDLRQAATLVHVLLLLRGAVLRHEPELKTLY
jgi:hypothetical protein